MTLLEMTAVELSGRRISGGQAGPSSAGTDVLFGLLLEQRLLPHATFPLRDPGQVLCAVQCLRLLLREGKPSYCVLLSVSQAV